MTVPSQEEFAEALSLVKHYSPWDQYFIEKYVSLSDNPTAQVVMEMRQSIRNESLRLAQSGVMKWLQDQSSFALARPKFFSNSEWAYYAGALLEDDHQEAAAVARVTAIFNRLKDRYSDRLAYLTVQEVQPLIACTEKILRGLNAFNDWLRTVLSAFDEYFHGSATENIAAKKRNLQVNLRAAIDGLRALQQIESDPFATQALAQFGEGKLFFGQLDKRINQLLTLSKIDEAAIYPVHRGDSTARERLFVYRLAMQNQLTFGTNKTDAIAALLNIEGVAQQIDERTIAKMCARFKESRWQLFGKQLQITAM